MASRSPRAEVPARLHAEGQNDLRLRQHKDVAPNTVMDVDRFEHEMAALTPSHAVSALNLSGIDRNFGNATLYTWTQGSSARSATSSPTRTM